MYLRFKDVLCYSLFILIFGSHILAEQGSEVVVLIAEHNGFIFKLNSTHTKIPYRDTSGVENIAYDPVLENIYWSNLHSHWINRIQLNGTGFTRFIQSPKCQGLTVDPIHRLLFYSDDSAKTIKRISFLTNQTTLIAMTTGSARPHDLAADFQAQLLYWTVLGVPRIEMSDYDGKNRKTVLHSTNMRIPTSIALDDTGSTLYWIDEHSSYNDIMAFDLINKKSSIVSLQGTLRRPFDIDVFNTTLYIIDKDQSDMYITLPLKGGRAVTHPTIRIMSGFRHIRVFSHPYECPIDRFGPECGQQCGQCTGQRCERKTGQCPEGCAPGWTRITCSEVCPDFFYGSMCMNTCGYCAQNASCSKIDGRCPGRCSSGWTGDRCLQECPGGFYGELCSRTCGHCSLGQACDKSSGQCSSGCDPGWSGHLCVDECPSGYYGVDCNNSCGQCGNNTTCDRETGKCQLGCEKGWSGNKCKNEVKQLSTSIIVLSVLVPIVLVVSGVGILVLFKKRRQARFDTAVQNNATPVTYAVMDEELQNSDTTDHLDFDQTNDTAALFQL